MLLLAKEVLNKFGYVLSKVSLLLICTNHRYSVKKQVFLIKISGNKLNNQFITLRSRSF